MGENLLYFNLIFCIFELNKFAERGRIELLVEIYQQNFKRIFQGGRKPTVSVFTYWYVFKHLYIFVTTFKFNLQDYNLDFKTFETLGKVRTVLQFHLQKCRLDFEW